VRFAFTEDQLAFRDAVRELLANECAPSVVRDAWGNTTGRTEDAWAHLGDMGVLGLLADEAAGGLGLSDLDLVLILEETGYVALPEPIVEHAAVGVPLLASAGHDAAAAAATGAITITTALANQGPTAYADGAAYVLVERSDGVHAVEPVAAGLAARGGAVDGSRRLFTVDRAGVGAGLAPVVARREGAALAFDRGVLGTAAQLVGLTRRMIDLTVEYTKERSQFGVPIGSFQAVKHHLADARIALEFARPLVYRAAWSVAQGAPSRAADVSMAKARASEAALVTARQALQCHGAIGYSFEYDLHLYMKRAWALAGAWGDAAWHRARVGRAILGPDATRPTA
jgi:alkylation response protein AidB-like acyl-CoA dehydrogenase